TNSRACVRSARPQRSFCRISPSSFTAQPAKNAGSLFPREVIMALYVFDGTGNEDNDGDKRDSNACKFFHAYEDADKNDDTNKEIGSLYLKGIGTRAKTFIGRSFSEAFGIGGHQRVRQ